MDASLTIYPRGARYYHGPRTRRPHTRQPSRMPSLSDFMPKEVQQSRANGPAASGRQQRRQRCAPRAVFQRHVTKTHNAFDALRDDDVCSAKRHAKSRVIRRPSPAQPMPLQGAWQLASGAPIRYTSAEVTIAIKTMLGLKTSPFAAEAAAAAAIAAEAAAKAATQTLSEEQLLAERAYFQLLADNRSMAKRLRAAEDLLLSLQGDAQRTTSSKTVRFANDDPETLMKPPPSDTRMYFKDSPPNSPPAVVAATGAADSAYLAKRGSSNAWRPNKRLPNTALSAGAVAAIAPPAAADGKKASWADECDDEDDMFADGW